MVSLTDCLREAGLFTYKDMYSTEGCRMVAEAVNLALATNPAVLQWDIKRELNNFQKSKEGRERGIHYGSIVKIEANRFLRNPEGLFYQRPLYDVVRKLVRKRTGTRKVVVLEGEGEGHIRFSKVFYRDRRAMEDYVKSRLSIERQILAKLRES